MAIVSLETLNEKDMMNKNRNNTLMQYANEVLNESGKILNTEALSIPESFNGQIAALGVSVAMSGILPTLAIYMKKSGNKKTDTQKIIEIIAMMINKDMSNIQKNRGQTPPLPLTINNADTLFKFAINRDNQKLLNALAKEVEECSVALKQVVRTYDLVKV